MADPNSNIKSQKEEWKNQLAEQRNLRLRLDEDEPGEDEEDEEDEGGEDEDSYADKLRTNKLKDTFNKLKQGRGAAKAGGKTAQAAQQTVKKVSAFIRLISNPAFWYAVGIIAFIIAIFMVIMLIVSVVKGSGSKEEAESYGISEEVYEGFGGSSGGAGASGGF